MARSPWRAREGAVEYFRGLWDRGITTSEIARLASGHFGFTVTKNATVGLAHRNDFPRRPSPINMCAAAPKSAGKKPTLPSAPAATIFTLPPLPAPTIGFYDCLPPPRLPAQRSRIAPCDGMPRQHIETVTVFQQVKPRTCCWPIGHPKGPDFRFCDSTATPGKPYCQEHANLAYVRVRDRKEHAA